MIERDFIRRMYAKYGAESDAARRPEDRGISASLVDRFLSDASIPLAVFHSRRLGRDFVLARDASSLEELAEPERRLPVLTFADCERLGDLGSADLSTILDVREALGPSAGLVAVRARRG